MTDKNAAKTPAKTPRSRAKKPDWSALASKAESAPKEEAAPDATPADAPAAIENNPAVRVTPSGKVVPLKKAQTFRLPPDVLKIIADARAEEAALGNNFTNDMAVTEALRAWGAARARKRNKS